MAFRALTLIERRLASRLIEPHEMHALIRAYMAGEVPDYQMAAWLMTVHYAGLGSSEQAALTDAMLESGVTLPKTGAPRVDKHSTGGIGDKVSLVLVPMVASLGLKVPMISGRGLGHTGGTLDKLEAIPGFRTNLSLDEAMAQLDRIGCFMISQTADLVPADRRLYALRDATATVDPVSLISASIVSKKLAEGLSGLVLDVTYGSGAFIELLNEARIFASEVIYLTRKYDCRTVAFITAMDRPRGWACGNALETEEAIHALHGEGPPDLMTITYALGADMLLLGGLAANHDDARAALERSITSGAAASKFQEIIEAQGGNPGVVDDPATLPQAPVASRYRAPRAGVITRMDGRLIGRGVRSLGGGRFRQEDSIDPTVGFVFGVKPGDRVREGQPIATIYARDSDGVLVGESTLDVAVEIGDEPEESLPLIVERLDRSIFESHHA
jgi:pyrimidine-nucleoside phosphorylase